VTPITLAAQLAPPRVREQGEERKKGSGSSPYLNRVLWPKGGGKRKQGLRQSWSRRRQSSEHPREKKEKSATGGIFYPVRSSISFLVLRERRKGEKREHARGLCLLPLPVEERREKRKGTGLCARPRAGPGEDLIEIASDKREKEEKSHHQRAPFRVNGPAAPEHHVQAEGKGRGGGGGGREERRLSFFHRLEVAREKRGGKRQNRDTRL